MINIILSGGSGTRLWPLSRTETPKQFVDLLQGDSLFQRTVQRNESFSNSFLIVTNKLQAGMAKQQLVNRQNVQYLLEPIGRNTAPAVAIACMMLAENDLVLVSSSDQLIKNQQNYLFAINEAKSLAEKGFLVTFGIKPSYPETGFGYILAAGNDVLAFKEKPDFKTATEYVNSQNYLWNCGMFCFKAGVFLNELKQFEPNIYSACKTAFNNLLTQQNTAELNLNLMQQIPSKSIDFAVMERSRKIKVVAADLDWSDLGSFDALMHASSAFSEKNNKNNNVFIDSTQNVIFGGSNKTFAFIDVNNLIVVDTPDSLLICKQGSSQKVSAVVDQLKAINPQIVAKSPNEFGSPSVSDAKTEVFVLQVNEERYFQTPENFTVIAVLVKGELEIFHNNVPSFSIRKGDHITVSGNLLLKNTSTEIAALMLILC